MTRPLKTSVLISGTGSNLQALIDARRSDRLDFDINHVISNVADARGLVRAENAGIATSVLEHGSFSSRDDFDRALALLIAAGDPDLVVLAGFMRIIGPEILQPLQGRIINLHPSLLPLHPGTDTYNRAIAAGDSRHGASIHFVTEKLEVFGRYAGFTALMPTMAGAADRCVIPEHPFDVELLAELLSRDRANRPSRYAVVLVSEGALDAVR